MYTMSKHHECMRKDGNIAIWQHCFGIFCLEDPPIPSLQRNWTFVRRVFDPFVQSENILFIG